MAQVQSEEPKAEKNGEGSKAKKPKKPAKITITEAWCKGCGICVAFCPSDTLELKGGKVSVKDINTCIKCMNCELRCPDFAITVEVVK